MGNFYGLSVEGSTFAELWWVQHRHKEGEEKMQFFCTWFWNTIWKPHVGKWKLLCFKFQSLQKIAIVVHPRINVITLNGAESTNAE